MSSSNFGPSELVIELAGKSNQYFLFKPLLERLRGRWSIMNERGTSDIGFSAMPDIPGMYICLDPKRRTLRVIDPLGFPENQGILDRANQIRKHYMGVGRPVEARVQEGLSDTEVKSIMWSMLEIIESGDCRLVNGVVPSRDGIVKMPGQLQLRYSDSSPDQSSRFASPKELENMGYKPEPVLAGGSSKASSSISSSSKE